MHASFPGLHLPAGNFPADHRRSPATSLYREIADGALFLPSRREVLQFSVSGIRSEGNRRGRPRRNTASGRPAKEDKKSKDRTASGDETSGSSSQEEIIALFRRIQSSISKGGPTVRNKRSSNSSKENRSTESVLEALRQYPTLKQVRDEGSSRARDKASPQRRVALNRDERTGDASLSKDFKLSRPVSNFVKRSPIPSSTSPKEGLPPTIADEVPEMERVDELKLTELKEFAKSKGIKGYSKLKKSELVELLRGSLKSQ